MGTDNYSATSNTARRELGRAAARPGPSSLYQIQMLLHLDLVQRGGAWAVVLVSTDSYNMVS